MIVLLVLFNTYKNDLSFTVPEEKGDYVRPWKKVIDTATDYIIQEGCAVYHNGDEILKTRRSMMCCEEAGHEAKQTGSLFVISFFSPVHCEQNTYYHNHNTFVYN